MNPSEISFAVSVLVAAIGVLIAGVSAWRNRGMPMTREEVLQDEKKELTQQLKDANAQVLLLLNDRLEDRQIIGDLQRRMSVLDVEAAYYKMAAAVPFRQRESRAGLANQPPRRLNGVQLRDLRGQLLDAYTTHEQWHTLIQDTDHQLDIVAAGDNLNTGAANALKQANAEGWIGVLIAEAARGRPNLAALQTLAATLLEALGPHASS